MKILICFGTRPEAIKMAPLISELKEKDLGFQVCVTAQHREMLDQVLQFFEILPDFDLDLMVQDQTLNGLSASILSSFDLILQKEKPELIIVQGDTTTAFICALAAFNRKIKIGHVEAGLRTYDNTNPFPEEGNRQLISRIADYHFAPTERAKNNLLSESVSKERIFITGNTIVDALKFAEDKINSGFNSEEILWISRWINTNKKIILVTGHRRENFGDRLKNLCDALVKISNRDDVQIIFPVHLNPQVKSLVDKELSDKENIKLIPPLQYPAFLWLLKKSSLVITDSGGIQEEAPSFNIPVIVTRKLTERMEAVETKNSFIVDSNSDIIEKKVIELLQFNLKVMERTLLEMGLPPNELLQSWKV